MVELKEQVKAKLKDRGKQDVEELWETIYDAYEDGGPNAVEDVVLRHLNQLKKGASREIKEIKEIIPKKKSRRR